MSRKIECVCAKCGKKFFDYPSRVKDGMKKYCSIACKSNPVTLICKTCGNPFHTFPSRLGDGKGKYCSKTCFLGRKNKRVITRECKYCGKSFTTRAWFAERGQAIYCSMDCAYKGKSGENSYQWVGGCDSYRGENWYKQHKLARLRDGDVCQYCHRKRHRGERKFPIHHIKPYREFNGDYVSANNLSNLITLCHQCHPKAERGLIPVQLPLDLATGGAGR